MRSGLIRERAGVRRVRFQDVRHTCATMLLGQGVPVRVVVDILGHSSTKVPTDIYRHVLPEALGRTATAIDDVFTSRLGPDPADRYTVDDPS